MGYQLDVMKKRHIVSIRTFGHVSMDEGIRYTKEAISAARKHKINKCLINHLNAHLDFLILEFFSSGYTMAGLGLTPEDRVAVVVKRDDRISDIIKFTLSKLGIDNIHYFSTAESAMEFLNKDE